MGRGWKRARRNLSTAPVLHPTAVLQGDQAVAAHQDLHWHQRECRPHSDLDGVDRCAAGTLPPTAQQLELEPVQSVRTLATAVVRLSRPLDLDEQAVPSAGGTRPAPVELGADLIASWTADSDPVVV